MIIKRNKLKEGLVERVYCGEPFDLRNPLSSLGKTYRELCEEDSHFSYEVTRIRISEFIIGSQVVSTGLSFNQVFGPYRSLIGRIEYSSSIPYDEEIRDKLIEFLQQLKIPSES